MALLNRMVAPCIVTCRVAFDVTNLISYELAHLKTDTDNPSFGSLAMRQDLKFLRVSTLGL